MTDNIYRSRQYPLVAAIDFTSADATSHVVINLPPGALLISGLATVSTAFNGTTPKLTVKDTAANSLFGDVDATAVDDTALVAGRYYPLGTSLTAAASGAPTAGEAFIHVTYVILDRTNEVYTP